MKTVKVVGPGKGDDPAWAEFVERMKKGLHDAGWPEEAIRKVDALFRGIPGTAYRATISQEINRILDDG